MIAIHSSPDKLRTDSTLRTVCVRYKSPAREVLIQIASAPWNVVDSFDISSEYKQILESALDSAAKRILSAFILNAKAAGADPCEIPESLFTTDALLEECTNAATEWLSKDELAEAWKNSATRKAIFNATKYANNPSYRKAYTRYEELVLKLSGKAVTLQPAEIDSVLAKLSDSDHDTVFGAFILRRCVAMRSRKDNAVVDLSIL